MDEGLSKKRGAHISGRLKNYMRWPIAMAIMLLLLNLWIYCIDIKARYTHVDIYADLYSRHWDFVCIQPITDHERSELNLQLSMVLYRIRF